MKVCVWSVLLVKRGISKEGFMNNRKGYVCFDNSCVEVELAETREQMETGLMNRINLSDNIGMIFIFDKERVPKLWMKNMLIYLDVIWIDDKGVIVSIDKNVAPCNEHCQPFGPGSYPKFALEVNGGYVDRYNINIGDNVRMIL
jgi:uncharacterized membrane protein (UPF0127 family)